MRTKASRHSHILVPDGLTARLMRTTRIRPWPIGTVWTPANLFPTGTEEGLFLDFSDISTLYTDQTFATNISAIGDPVGGVIDKSQGGRVGDNIAAPISSADWSGTQPEVTVSDGVISFDGLAIIGAAQTNISGLVSPGQQFMLRITVENFVSGAIKARMQGGGGLSGGADITIVANGTYEWRVSAEYPHTILEVFRTAATVTLDVTKLELLPLPGNHLIQATAAARPIWTRHPKSGVRSLANKEYDKTAWQVGSGAVIGNYVSDPVGGNAAWSASMPNQYSNVYLVNANVIRPLGDYTISVWLRCASAASQQIHIGITSDGSYGKWQQVVVTDEWQKFEVTFDHTDATKTCGIIVQNRTVTACVTEIYQAQLELASSATPYQTRVSKYNVTEAGVDDCYGLTFDGVDDYMVTAAKLNLSGTNKITTTVGVFKGKETSSAIVLGRGLFGTQGDFGIAAPGNSGAQDFYYQYRNSASGVINGTGNGVYDAPVNAVVTAGNDVSAVGFLRVDGAEISNTGSAFDTNYPDAVIFVGATNNGGSPALYFTGTIYGVTLTDYILDADQLSELETWTAANTPEVTLA